MLRVAAAAAAAAACVVLLSVAYDDSKLQLQFFSACLKRRFQMRCALRCVTRQKNLPLELTGTRQDSLGLGDTRWNYLLGGECYVAWRAAAKETGHFNGNHFTYGRVLASPNESKRMPVSPR